MNSFDMSAAPEVTAEDGEKVRQVAFSSGEQQRAGPQREKGIIFHGGLLVSVGVSAGGKCEQLNIISECCAVWWFYMLLGVPDAHLSHTHVRAHTHTRVRWDIPVKRWSITGFILFDLHSLNPESGSPAWAGVSVASCSQSPSYQRCGSMALSLSAISAAHRWLSMWTFSLHRLLCGSWPQNPCHLKTVVQFRSLHVL